MLWCVPSLLYASRRHGHAPNCQQLAFARVLALPPPGRNITEAAAEVLGYNGIVAEMAKLTGTANARVVGEVEGEEGSTATRLVGVLQGKRERGGGL